MTSKKKEEAAVKLNQQQFTGNVRTALYLGDQIDPSAPQILETAGTKLQRRKTELLKEKEQRKSFPKGHEVGTKLFFPKSEPLDLASTKKKHYYYPIISYDTVPTLEQLIHYVKEDEYVDPRFKIDKQNYKIRKIIHKYNLDPEIIMKKLRNTKRRHAMNPLTYNYSWGEYLKKRYASSLEYDEDDEWNDEITNDKERSPELSFNKYSESRLILRKDSIDAEKLPKPKQASLDGGIAYCDELVKHERLHTLTEQGKDFQDDSSKTPVTLGDVTRALSISPEEQDSIQEIRIISTSENVENQLQNTLSRFSSNESTKDSHLSGLADSQSEPHTMLLDIITDISTAALADHFPKISVISEDHEEDIISDSSEDSNVVQEQEQSSKNKFDTTKLNRKYSAEKILQQKLLEKNDTIISNILKKHYSFKEDLKASHVDKPVNDQRLAKAKSRKLKIGPRSRQFKERRPVVIGKLRTFNFLSKVSVNTKVFLSPPIPIHFPCSSTEKFALRLYQALDDFVVRRESVMSNKNRRYCATVTFTRKSVFSIHRN